MPLELWMYVEGPMVNVGGKLTDSIEQLASRLWMQLVPIVVRSSTVSTSTMLPARKLKMLL